MTDPTHPTASEVDVDEAMRAYQRFLLIRWGLVGFSVFAVLALAVTWFKDRPVIDLDPIFRIPARPGANVAPYDVAIEVRASIVMLAIGLVGTALGVWEWFRSRSVVGMAVAVSAVFATIPEGLFQLLGAAYFPWSETEPFGELFRVLGRSVPAFVAASWFACGLLCIGAYCLLQRKPSTRTLWYLWFAAMLGEVVVEEVLLKLHLYRYYGNQPLVLISDLPLWWIPCRTVGLLLAAFLAYRYRDALHGWRSAACFVITPLCVCVSFAMIALPAWIATNSDLPWLPTQLLGLITIALGVAAFMGALRFVLNRDPLDLDYEPVAEADEFAVVR